MYGVFLIKNKDGIQTWRSQPHNVLEDRCRVRGMFEEWDDSQGGEPWGKVKTQPQRGRHRSAHREDFGFYFKSKEELPVGWNRVGPCKVICISTGHPELRDCPGGLSKRWVTWMKQQQRWMEIIWSHVHTKGRANRPCWWVGLRERKGKGRRQSGSWVWGMGR